MPYYELPPKGTWERHSAPFILAGIMMFPDEDARQAREQFGRVWAAQRYKDVLPVLPKLSVHIPRHALEGDGGQAMRARCAELIAELERKGFPGITMAEIPESEGVRLKLYVDPEILKRADDNLLSGRCVDICRVFLNEHEKGTYLAAKSLTNLLGLSQHVPEKASLRLARGAVALGSGGSSSEKAVSEVVGAESKFAPVAHLWAAFWMMDRQNSISGLPCAESEVDAFVFLSERLRMMGEAVKPVDGNGPALDARLTWKLHPSVEIDVETPFEFGAFPAEIAALLSRKMGRPRDYPWEDFDAELYRLLDYEGLPSRQFGESGWRSQADVERRMVEWCQMEWGREPADSSIKARVKAGIDKFGREGRKV